MQDYRKTERFKTQAHVYIPDILERESLLKNLSITGCCVECSANTKIKPGTTYHLQIIPESNAKIDSFVLEVESMWMRSAGDTGEIGFNIVASPRGKQFQNYVDYLAYRSSLPRQA